MAASCCCSSLSSPSYLPRLCSPLRSNNSLSLPHNRPWSTLTSIRMMGGGPRTFPGGVTKWQWKRMQQKKTRQIEKARLQRERQIYQMRRRAELMAATPVLEKPWERLSRFRSANHVTADEQIKALASRFERFGAEDLWTENDGPQNFLKHDGEPSAGFSSPNTVQSSKIYPNAESSAAGASVATRASIENQKSDMISGLGRLDLNSRVGPDVESRDDRKTLRSIGNLQRNRKRRLTRNTADSSQRGGSVLSRHANPKWHRDP